MPEYNNGIPNAQQTNQNPSSMPGLNDNSIYQSQVGSLQVGQQQNRAPQSQIVPNQTIVPQQITEPQPDRSDTAGQIKEGELGDQQIPQEPVQEPNTLPGLDDNPMYQPQTVAPQEKQEQGLTTENQVDQQKTNAGQQQSDANSQIKKAELAEEDRQRETLEMAISKALAIHMNEFSTGEFQIQEAKMLVRPGKDRADTAQLSIATRDGLDFQMYFDEEGGLILENHKNDISQNMVGGKYLDAEKPEMDLSTPEKQDAFLMEMDQSKAGLTLRKEEMDKSIQEMGFQNKEEMVRDTGVDMNEELTAPHMDKDQTKDNIQAKAADSILKNATMVVDGNAKFDTYRNVNDVLQTKGAEKIVAVGTDAYSIDKSGSVKKENLKVVGPVSAVHLAGGYARDSRLNQVFTTSGNPEEGIGVGMGGAPQGVKELNSSVAMSRSINEAPSVNSAKMDSLFEKSQEQGHHTEDMFQSNGSELISELHTDNDVTGRELSAIADRYGMELDEVEEMYHNKLASGIPEIEAMDETKKECDEKYAEDMHEPDLEPRSPFDAPHE